MDQSVLLSQLLTFMTAVAVLAGIPLAVATAVGIIISFIQAITQIQDQTLSQTFKIAAIAVVLISFAPFLTAPLLNATAEIFNSFHSLAP
ncbi:EscS/YscS/HrcS family type III secretion system export apparatus protein [Parasedimentitalea maritima]|uniref:EscS/YscS/HrcS family type III secretion system export apparatus protein n=1 Tax=Parasedimentitalea maritima TaxID=2578117 RepID=A0ABY2UQ79_9RHOB|nr:flagellar biosynthetic protein FliQ [Zongyanglinia marina]TLP55323.1 EscS/YscS/HrcS family type III secretion system export apparatus protein [Zongyanglinia marina]